MARDNRKRNKKKMNDGYEPKGDALSLATPLDKLGLSEKTEGILRDGGVTCAKDLAKRRAGEIYRIRYVGKRECLEVTEALKKLGLDYEYSGEGKVAYQLPVAGTEIDADTLVYFALE